MRQPGGRRFRLLLSAAWLCCAAAGAMTLQDDAEEPAAATTDHAESAAQCPCFEPSEFTELPGSTWDLCLDTDSTVQVAKWFGKSTPQGREGFNLIATTPTARTAGGSCLLLRRFRTGGVLEQVHSTFLDLPIDIALSCHAMLRAWLETRGGCESEVAGKSD